MIPIRQDTRAALAAALVGAALLAGAVGTACAADLDIGVSIGISQPGVYGRIDIGRFPQPQVVVAQPVVVLAPPRGARARPVEPVYMWVPPGHRKKWSKHCRAYDACGVPVVFVQDAWYERHVMPQAGGKARGKGRGRDG
jgi:hypothetical protein